MKPVYRPAHACHCVPSAPARNRLLASAMNQTKLPFPAGARFLWPATVGPGDPARRREWSSLFPTPPRFTRPAADGTEPGRSPSKRFPSNTGVRRLRRRLFTRLPRTGRTRSEARSCFVAGNRDTACLTPRLTNRGIALARYTQYPAPAPRQRDRPVPPRSTRQGKRAWQRGAGLALPDAGLSDANPDGTYSQPRCTRRHLAGTEPLVIAAFRPPSALPEPP